MIGADPNIESKPENFFAGAIREIRISSGARYEQDFRVPSGLYRDQNSILLLKLNEGRGTTAKDESGNGHDGIIRGATWTRIRK